MNFRFTLSIFAFFFVSSFASAQNKLNGDSLFTQARAKAFAGNHAEAIPLLDTVLTHFPNYADVKIFKARILSWDKNYTEADTLLQQVLRDKPDNIDAHKAITDNAMWSKNYKGAVTYAEQGILVDPNNIDLLLKKLT